MQKHFLELIRRASTSLPDDVIRALKNAKRREKKNSPAEAALGDISANIKMARDLVRPICQDTGTNIWYVYYPASVGQKKIKKAITLATKVATKKAYLRPNAVDPITGKNSGDNTGIGAPDIHFYEWNRKSIAADLLLKGGGCENVSATYALPDTKLNAGRNIDGIRKAVLDAVFNAQGKGCAPGIIGVGVGGDRATSMVEAKEQLFRLVDDKNPDRELAALEKKLLAQINTLGIGPMGFGGLGTALGVKIGKRHRLPASFFVSVAYMCWAARRCGVVITGDRAKYDQMTVIAKKFK